MDHDSKSIIYVQYGKTFHNKNMHIHQGMHLSGY